MIKINSVEWGKIKVNGREYGQVLIIGDEVFERDSEKLHQLFDTTHQMGDWEAEQLVADNPEVIVVGNGWDGVLEINSKFKVQSAKLGIELKTFRTPQAMEEYNKLVAEGKKVSALIHTTC